jgi:hypothetical protein
MFQTQDVVGQRISMEKLLLTQQKLTFSYPPEWNIIGSHQGVCSLPVAILSGCWKHTDLGTHIN